MYALRKPFAAGTWNHELWGVSLKVQPCIISLGIRIGCERKALGLVSLKSGKTRSENGVFPAIGRTLAFDPTGIGIKQRLCPVRRGGVLIVALR